MSRGGSLQAFAEAVNRKFRWHKMLGAQQCCRRPQGRPRGKNGNFRGCDVRTIAKCEAQAQNSAEFKSSTMCAVRSTLPSELRRALCLRNRTHATGTRGKSTSAFPSCRVKHFSAQAAAPLTAAKSPRLAISTRYVPRYDGMTERSTDWETVSA